MSKSSSTTSARRARSTAKPKARRAASATSTARRRAALDAPIPYALAAAAEVPQARRAEATPAAVGPAKPIPGLTEAESDEFSRLANKMQLTPPAKPCTDVTFDGKFEITLLRELGRIRDALGDLAAHVEFSDDCEANDGHRHIAYALASVRRILADHETHRIGCVPMASVLAVAGLLTGAQAVPS